MNGCGVRSELREAMSLIKRLKLDAVQSFRDELHTQSTSAISQSEGCRQAAYRVQHVLSIDRVERGHVGQVRNQQLEHLRDVISC